MSDFKEKKLFKYRNLTPLWISVFIDIIGFSLILPLAVFLAEDYKTSIFMIGLVLSINAMFSFIFGPILGKLSDKYGRRPLLLISQFGTFIGFIVLAFSNSLELLIISRIIDGIFGGNFPIAKAIVSDVVPPKDRGIQMANIGIAHVLASLIGPGLGGLFYFIGGGIFLPGIFAAGLSVFTMIITILMLKESWPRERRVESHKFSIENNEKIHKNKNALFLLTLFGFHSVSFMIMMASISFFSRIVLKLELLEISLIMMVSGIIRTTIRFTLFKPTLRKLGESNAIRLGLTMFLICFFLIGFSPNVVMFFILLMIISFAASLTRGPLNSMISQTVSPKIQGKVNGYSSSLDSFAQIVGPLIGTFILQFFMPYWLGIVIAAIAFPPFIMAFQKIEEKKYKRPLSKEES
ncbi:MAG: MFS transporter [Candidatus Lokiarchaeota archaeon]|nr:MFS transporter [Candidatus Lokiarchaeota archaeon]